MKKFGLLIALVLLNVGAGCKSKPDSAGQAGGAASTPAATGPVPSIAKSAAATATAAAGLSEDEVNRFVSRWELAQNEHDFATYSGLYAERFMGVKRVGSYSKRFDRAGWLVDRKPMLQGTAKVKVTDIALVAAAGSTRVVFTQEFTSPGFRDVGKKELFLVATSGGTRISREEMLSSEVSATAPNDETVLAYHRDGPVLQRGFAKKALSGAPRLLSAPYAIPIEIGLGVTPESLSEGTRAWLGREVTAYAPNGQTCTGRVARFEVRVQAVPHFGMRQGWNGELEAPKATPGEIAATIERMAQNEEHFVVGVLDRACAGTWASRSAHTFTAARPATGKLRDSAIAAFKGLPAYAELQRKFAKEGGDAKRAWETMDGELNVVELRAAGRPALVLVAARGGVGCSGVNGALSAFWQLAGTEPSPLTPVTPSVAHFITLRGGLDQGEAGMALLAGPDGYDNEVAVLRLAAPAQRRVLFSTAFWDCDC